MTDQLVEDGTGTRLIRTYNYEKFFDALAVANHDKWDDNAPTYTSWQPIGNQANRTEASIDNARASDMVRQFAIDWYLEDEIAKLIRPVAAYIDEKENGVGDAACMNEKENGVGDAACMDEKENGVSDAACVDEKENGSGNAAYADELYDMALFHAIRKAENYLKPFFSYDLDEIYSIAWDSAADGGADSDKTTLSADTLYGDAADTVSYTHLTL